MKFTFQIYVGTLSSTGAYAGFSEGGCREGGGGVPRSAIGPNSVCFVESSIFTAFV